MSIIFDHDWTAVADTPAGAAGSTAGADQDGGWTDRAGGQASVGGGVLLLAGTGGYGGIVYRPASEAVAHGRITVRLRPLGPNGLFWICPRVVDGAVGDLYTIRFILIGRIISGDFGFPFAGANPGPFVSLGAREPDGTQEGDDVSISVEAPAPAGGTTTYVVVIENHTLGTSTTKTIADATAALQGPGSVGLISEGGAGAVGLRGVMAEEVVYEPARHRMRLRAGAGGGVAILT